MAIGQAPDSVRPVYTSRVRPAAGLRDRRGRLRRRRAGTLIGADLTHLSAIRRMGAPLASIGGAGTFDGVFLSGVIAVLLAAAM
ncbi:DUF1614 domain-containing protein [Actinoplanes awajinensis]|uniref:DUF1614 domain-containing protein n=1 Tax=Actinoplanes awajinensis TaxID=135946 RepID=UPI000AC37085|nr:DUF1614 domain-containing protein [Actinoplanes awajinensis]